MGDLDSSRRAGGAVGAGSATTSTPPGKRTLTGAIQRRASGTGGVAPAAGAPTAPAAGEGNGSALPFRAELEAAFGVDFSTVHATTGDAAGMRALGAEAATQGERVSFASASPSKELVAHELAHVQQQREGRVSGGGVDPDPGLEREADAVAARAARGERVGTGAAAGAAPAGGPIQRKKDALAAIDWTQATGGKKISAPTNANVVYKVDFAEGPVVVKMYNAGAPAKEIAATRMVDAFELPGVTAPGMRYVEGEEKQACQAALEKIAGAKLPALTLAVMDNMPGEDFEQSAKGTERDPLDLASKDGQARLGNTGSLLAFSHLVDGTDRFDDPKGMGSKSGNNSNLRFAAQGTDLQAIDTTLPDAMRYGFQKDGGASEANKQQKKIGNFMDDAILNQDSALGTTLAKQLGLDPADPQTLALIQGGFVGGVDAIASANVDFKGLVDGIGGNSALFQEQEKDGSMPAYAKYLQQMQAFYAAKSQFARAVQGTDKTDTLRSEGLELVRQANGLAVGRPVDDLALATKHAKTSDGKHGPWPAELTALREGKNSIGKKTTKEQLADVVAKVPPAFTAISAPTVPPKVVQDFDRVVAKIIQRAQKFGLAPAKDASDAKVVS